MRLVALVALIFLAAPASHCAAESADSRILWVYEGGWFGKAKDGSWQELNEQTYRKLGRPSKFSETKRTKEFVELRDEERQVSVRLSVGVLEVRWDSDGKDAEWKPLYKGRWKKPAP